MGAFCGTYVNERLRKRKEDRLSGNSGAINGSYNVHQSNHQANTGMHGLMLPVMFYHHTDHHSSNSFNDSHSFDCNDGQYYQHSGINHSPAGHFGGSSSPMANYDCGSSRGFVGGGGDCVGMDGGDCGGGDCGGV